MAVCDEFGNDLQVIIGVHMPYFKWGDLTQTDNFISTVDSLQSVMDNFTSSVLVKICGDFWVQNGRPRSGEVFKCYKQVKKLFRGLCRRSVKAIQTNDYRVASGLYRNHNLKAF